MFKRDINEMKKWLLYTKDDKLYRAYIEKLTDEEVTFFYNMYYVFMEDQIEKFTSFVIKYKERY